MDSDKEERNNEIEGIEDEDSNMQDETFEEFRYRTNENYQKIKDFFDGKTDLTDEFISNMDLYELHILRYGNRSNYETLFKGILVNIYHLSNKDEFIKFFHVKNSGKCSHCGKEESDFILLYKRYSIRKVFTCSECFRKEIQEFSKELYLFLLIYCREYKAKLPSELYKTPPCRDPLFLLKRDNINFEIKITIRSKNGNSHYESIYVQDAKEFKERIESKTNSLIEWINAKELEIEIEDRIKWKYKIKD